MSIFLLWLALVPSALPARETLAAPEPRVLLELLDLRVSVFDSDPTGSLPALVCLHAVGHGGGDYSAVVSAFASTHRVIVLDWPGHGASSDDPHPASAERYTAVLAAVVDALALDRFVLIGNSIGGAAAIQYASLHPERVRALVLADPGGLDPGGWVARLYIGQVAGRFRRGAEGDAAFPRWYERYYKKILVTPESFARRAEIVAQGPEMAPVLAEAWESFARPEADLRARLPGLELPVLVTWADRDRVIRWSRTRAALQALPEARVIHFDAGHSVFLERPEAFCAELGRFLGELP